MAIKIQLLDRVMIQFLGRNFLLSGRGYFTERWSPKASFTPVYLRLAFTCHARARIGIDVIKYTTGKLKWACRKKKKIITNLVRDLGLTRDNCRGHCYDGAGNMAGRYTGALTLIQHQFSKFILLLDKFILVELTSHTNCWIHPRRLSCYWQWISSKHC